MDPRPLLLAAVYQEKISEASFISKLFLSKKWLAQLERAFEIDPSNLRVRSRLIGYYINAPSIGGGDVEKGTKLARETIAIDEIEGRMLLALAFGQADKIDQAIQGYKAVLEVDSGYGPAFNRLGYIYLRRKNYSASEQNFRKYVEVAPQDPNSYDSLGDYYIERGFVDSSIVMFQKAVDLNPMFAVSRFKLAQKLVEKGRKKEAIAELETLLKLTPRSAQAEEARDLLDDLQD